MQSAGLWRRFVCMGYEGLLLLGPTLVLGFLYAVIVGQDQGHPGHEEAKRTGLQILMLSTYLAYFVWGWAKGRVTLPMQTLGLRLVDAQSGGPVSTRQALVRGLVGLVSGFSGLWLVVGLLRPDRQTLHDWAAGTRLVYQPRSR